MQNVYDLFCLNKFYVVFPINSQMKPQSLYHQNLNLSNNQIHDLEIKMILNDE